ncbi:tRNA methyltransferase ppm2, partial [Cryomyces antarcticus]
SIEPFDEWEEFALFACHYFLLVAEKIPTECPTRTPSDDRKAAVKGSAFEKCRVSYKEHMIGFLGGLGAQSRLTTCDVYSDSQNHAQIRSPPSSLGYMCHTTTSLGGSDVLMVGGRASPDKARDDCWLRHGDVWSRAGALSPGRYRHCAVPVAIPQSAETGTGVLVFGGKASNGNVLDDWWLWRPAIGWELLNTITGQRPCGRFGACVARKSQASVGSVEFSLSTNSGYLTGGMSENGLIISDLWEWELRYVNGHFILELRDVSADFSFDTEHAYGRFGAALVPSCWGLLLIGGVTGKRLLRHEDEIVVLESRARLRVDVHPRPLLVGFGAANVGTSPNKSSVLIIGGGSVCFSFGTFWNEGCFLLGKPKGVDGMPWHFQIPDPNAAAMESINEGGHQVGLSSDQSSTATSPQTTYIPRIQIDTAETFQSVLSAGQPVIIEELDLGTCIKRWTLEYLRKSFPLRHSKAQSNKTQVVVHSSPTRHMNFQTKNFSYITKPFGEFLDAIERGEKLYLRALSSNDPAGRPTSFSQDYPSIAADFKLPYALGMVAANAHSSPLRISGPVTMWLHYDVMANVLCQIRGRKRLLLYPPSDVTQLGFVPGASSSSIDVFETDASAHPPLAHTHPHEALLEPGDVLFIPALWLHTAAPTEGVSVAVNIFFRNLEKGYAAGKDVYGNRDLQAYEKGRKDVERIAKAFEGLPVEIRRFYMERLGMELLDKARAPSL